MNEELKNLFEGSELSDEFKTKVSELFEATVAEQVKQAKEQLEESYSKKAEEYAEYVVTELEEKTDEYVQTEIIPMVEKYLDYAVQENFKQNEPIIESQIKVELADSFLKGFAGVAENYNVAVPQGQDNLIEELQTKLDEMQSRFDSLLDENKQLKEEIIIDQMSDIVDAKVVDLTETQKEKFYASAARVKFQDAEQYKAAIDELYESHFPTADDSNTNVQTLIENVDENVVVKKTDTWLDSVFSKI